MFRIPRQESVTPSPSRDGSSNAYDFLPYRPPEGVGPHRCDPAMVEGWKEDAYKTSSGRRSKRVLGSLPAALATFSSFTGGAPLVF